MPSDNDPDNRIKHLPTLLNNRLPIDIRMISCMRFTQSFRARQACFWREYEYLLPITPIITYLTQQQQQPLLLSHKQIKEEFLIKFKRCLQKLEGAHSYHNYHRMPRRALKGSRSVNPSSPSTTTSSPPVLSHSDTEDEDEEREEELGSDSSIGDGAEGEESVEEEGMDDSSSPSHESDNLYKRWEQSPRDVVMKTQGAIYCCEVVGLPVVRGGDECIQIRVRGQAFLLQ